MSGKATAHAGITAAALRWQVNRGVLIRLAPTVYRLRDHPPTWHSRVWAALLEVEPLTAYVSHRSAGRLHGLYVYRDAMQVELTARRGRDHDTTLSRFHATSLLDADHVTVVDGIPCTTLARTVFDLCGDPDRRPIRSESGRTLHRLRMLQVANDAIRRQGLEVERECRRSRNFPSVDHRNSPVDRRGGVRLRLRRCRRRDRLAEVLGASAV
jgi:hypothetical protein